ncbi:hypothetical protein [Lucifera butyrica]|uniref:hypothetical protein n=1 Tax=Lucifera butyrica TaxID=1351585 RepID=UPI000F0378F3|nr:hypothetical protein [Lucifera butyrica]
MRLKTNKKPGSRNHRATITFFPQTNAPHRKTEKIPASLSGRYTAFRSPFLLRMPLVKFQDFVKFEYKNLKLFTIS